MARSIARCLLITAAFVAVLTQLAVPTTFVQPPAAAAASAMAAAPSAMAFAPDFADAQITLARVFPTLGGKWEKEKNLVMPIPDEEGFTDSQVATCLVIALLTGIAAIDLAKGLYKGIQPDVSRKGKATITPLVKRMMEKGF